MTSANLVLGYMPRGTGAAFPFSQVYQSAVDVMVRGMENIDALVVWGGIDIHPSYYNQRAHSTNQQSSNSTPIRRDLDEWKAMLWAKANNIPIIGVCRGAQMACVFSGGRLIQDVTGHEVGHHELYCEDGVIRTSNSCHHQMMYPFDVEHRLIAWTKGKSKIYEDGDGDVDMSVHDFQEPEIVFFPETNALAIQAHPEWMDKDCEFVKYCVELVRQEFLNEVEA